MIVRVGAQLIINKASMLVDRGESDTMDNTNVAGIYTVLMISNRL